MTRNPKLSSGVAGLDTILRGGLPAGQLYLAQGSPGVGKTTLGLQFLLAGPPVGEASLYISLTETKDEIAVVARSHGWPLGDIEIYEPSDEELISERNRQTLFHTSEVELAEATQALIAAVDRVRPSRVVIDSISQIRLLAQHPLRYRHQMRALKAAFAERGCTVLLLDDTLGLDDAFDLQTVSHGVIDLEQTTPSFGSHRRRLRVKKMRGVPFSGGYHDMEIATGGLRVYPRLVAAEHRSEITPDMLSSGLPALDLLLGGGLERGTSTLIMGPAGAGKSSIALQYALATAERGDRAALYIFDETLATLLTRARGFGMALDAHLENGRMTVRQIDPAELTPGQFAHVVRQAVEEEGVRTLVLDGLAGYFNAMPADQHLTIHLHELLAFLGHKGANTFLVFGQHGLFQQSIPTREIDVSYLADTVILLRYFEFAGEVRKALSIFKKRSGRHETTIRELRLGERGITIGETLKDFRGVLTGMPVYSASDSLASNGK